MTVQDDLRRLSQLDSIYLGWSAQNDTGTPVTSWHKGKLTQSNDGDWIFRASSTDGAIVGFQLGEPGVPNTNWSSSEGPSTGIQVIIPIIKLLPPVPPTPGNVPLTIATVYVQQELPLDLTN